MRALFVSTTVALALAFAITAAASESRLLVRALIVGFVPAIWAVSHVFERLRGRDLWHFTAPYPYRWMRERGETAPPQRDSAGERSDDGLETGDSSPLPVAA
jgi:hypothetical protein